MDFSFGSLMAAFVFGVIGIYLFKESKKRANLATISISIGLMAYPYFVVGTAMNWIVGFLLCGLAWYFWY